MLQVCVIQTLNQCIKYHHTDMTRLKGAKENQDILASVASILTILVKCVSCESYNFMEVQY